MGQANARGTYQERQAQAVERAQRIERERAEQARWNNELRMMRQLEKKRHEIRAGVRERFIPHRKQGISPRMAILVGTMAMMAACPGALDSALRRKGQ